MSRMIVVAVVVALSMVGPAQADWGRGYVAGRYYYPTYYYYPPTPVYVAPVVVCPAPVVVRPAPGSGFYAQPIPAPASQTKEPPLDKKTGGPPSVTESRLFSPGEGRPAPVNERGMEACKVGFWNVAGRDVTVTINGKSYVIPRNRNLTLTLSREFSYQVDGRTAQKETVPAEGTTHEIVIR